MEPATVLYDGTCGMCRRTVRLAERHGRPGMLQPVDNASPEGIALLRRHGLEGAAADTLVVVAGRRTATHSAAVIQVARRLAGWRRLAALLWIVPRPLRDAVYRRIAARRHTACPLPSSQHP